MLAQNHIFSFTPKSLNPLEKSRDLEFDFWVPSRMRNHHSRSCDPDSPTLWKRENSSASVAKDVDTSPLLPQDHHYSNLSPSSRTRRIEEGRREMMEMIRNLPESSYKLSLKDIVDEQLSSQLQTSIKSITFRHFFTMSLRVPDVIVIRCRGHHFHGRDDWCTVMFFGDIVPTIDQF